jgi:2-polyprenyl-6-methoxyphenol hydroxylase-like FAD-dependent oxidoreductase
MEYDVLVAGAGPVGLMLATELRLAGARVLVVERRTELDTAVKAGAINTASAEALDRRGLLRRLFPDAPDAAGSRRPPFVGHFAGIQVPADPLDEEDPSLRGRFFMVPQAEVERILGQRAAELGVEVWRGAEVGGFDADEAGVTVHLVGRADVRVGWLVGCDGGRSLVRRLAGFEFPGTDPEITGRQAVVTMAGAERLGRGWQHTPTGVYVHGPMPGRVRTVEFDGPGRHRSPRPRSRPACAASVASTSTSARSSAARATRTTRGRRRTIGAVACCSVETPPTCTRPSAARG